MKLRLTSLKALINISQEQAYVEELSKLGVVSRVYEILKENVRQDLKNVELDLEDQAIK